MSDAFDVNRKRIVLRDFSVGIRHKAFAVDLNPYV